MQLEIIYALQEQISFRFQMREIRKFIQSNLDFSENWKINSLNRHFFARETLNLKNENNVRKEFQITTSCRSNKTERN